ncbi:hypothetical protein FOA52_010384 [Chlamydomonas sp. UWO 241]|nr:hypothetical protein FOA52_010384 [Chlamydomonas sp. UWO 241]
MFSDERALALMFQLGISQFRYHILHMCIPHTLPPLSHLLALITKLSPDMIRIYLPDADGTSQPVGWAVEDVAMVACEEVAAFANHCPDATDMYAKFGDDGCVMLSHEGQEPRPLEPTGMYVGRRGEYDTIGGVNNRGRPLMLLDRKEDLEVVATGLCHICPRLPRHVRVTGSAVLDLAKLNADEPLKARMIEDGYLQAGQKLCQTKFTSWHKSWNRGPAHPYALFYEPELLHLLLRVVNDLWDWAERIAAQMGLALRKLMRGIGLKHERPIQGFAGNSCRQILENRRKWLPCLADHDLYSVIVHAFDLVEAMIRILTLRRELLTQELVALYGRLARQLNELRNDRLMPGYPPLQPGGVAVRPWTWKAYDHYLCHHLEDIMEAALGRGSMLPAEAGSSWVENLNQVFKHALESHSSHGSGRPGAETDDLKLVLRRAYVSQCPTITQHYWAAKPQMCGCGQPLAGGHDCPLKDDAEAVGRGADTDFSSLYGLDTDRPELGQMVEERKRIREAAAAAAAAAAAPAAAPATGAAADKKRKQARTQAMQQPAERLGAAAGTSGGGRERRRAGAAAARQACELLRGRR